jgi:alpha-ribazole phosphatase
MVRDLDLAFVRHGMTKANAERRYVGFSDVPLLPQEQKRLRETGSAYPRPEAVVTSDLLRCRQTAEALFGALHVPVYAMREWREINFGDWEGKTFAELKDVKEYQHWLKAPFSSAPPNGERYGDFQERIERALTKTVGLAQRLHVSRLAVVTHGGPIRCMLEQYAPEERPFWEWSVPFGGGWVFTSTLERWEERKRCISLLEVPFKGSGNGCAAFTN